MKKPLDPHPARMLSILPLVFLSLVGTVRLAMPSPDAAGRALQAPERNDGMRLLPVLPTSGGPANLVALAKPWRYSSGRDGAESELLSAAETIPGVAGSVKGYHFRTIQTGEKPYYVLLKRTIPVALPKDKGYRLRFRACSPDAVPITAAVELGEKPFTKSLKQEVKLTGAWKEFSLPFRSVGYSAAGSTITFFLGHDRGEVKLGDVRLEPDMSAASLPLPGVTKTAKKRKPAPKIGPKGALDSASRLVGLTAVSSSVNLLPSNAAWRYTKGKANVEKVAPPRGTAPAYRFRIVSVGDKPSNVLAKCDIPPALPEGQVFRLRFTARSTTKTPLTAIVELDHKPFSKSLTKQVNLSGQWKEFVLPFRSQGYDKDGSTVTFFLGHKKGEIELAGVQLERAD